MTDTEATEVQPAISVTSPFWDLIPYHNEELSMKTTEKDYPFWENKEQDAKNIRDHDIVAILIAIIALLSTITQFAFFIAAPSPYRWISFGFWLSCQLFNLLWVFSYSLYVEKDDRWWYRLTMTLQIFVTPVLPFTWIHVMSTFDDKKTMLHSLFMKSLLSLTTTIIQAIPQMVILIVMMINDNIELFVNSSGIINWSFIVSLLSIITFCMVLGSIFEYKYSFLLNTLWLLLDFMIMIFIVAEIVYDDRVLLLFYIDIGILGFWIFLVMILVNLAAIQLLNEDEDQSCIVMICAVGCIICLFMFIVPFLCYLHIFTLIGFSILEQVFNWSLFPFNMRMFGKEDVIDWYDYIIYSWIMNGNDTEEKNDRLCCANMVIMDTEYQHRNQQKDANLRDIMSKNIRESMKFSEECVKYMSFENKFKFTVIVNEDPDKWYKKAVNVIFKWTVTQYFISRLFHFFVPIIIIISYMDMDNIGYMAKISIYGMITLFGLCILCIFIGLYSLKYYRLIMRINTINNDYLKTTKTYIANCHGQFGALKALIDCCGVYGGNRDIANVIFGFCYTNQAIA